MARLFGYLGTDYSRMQCALHLTGDALNHRVFKDSSGWGLGFYQNDRALYRKKPKTPKGEVKFPKLAADIYSHALVGHLRYATIGDVTGENTQPFRYKLWLFEHAGTIYDWDRIRDALMEHVPEYLQRYILGQTDSEVLMYLFLSRLSKAVNLNNPLIPPEEAGTALRDTIRQVNDIAAELKIERTPTANIIATNGKTLVASAQGMPMYHRTIDGIEDCEICRNPPLFAGHDPGPVHHSHFKAVFVAGSESGEIDDSWTRIEDGSILWLNHDMTIETVPLTPEEATPQYSI